MRRSSRALWSLLLLQLLPILVIVLGASGILDPLGRSIIASIPLPAPGESPGVVINATRAIAAYWFVVCLWLIPLAALVAVVYVAFDEALTKWERLAWALGFIFGEPVTVVLYCVLGLLGGRKSRGSVA